MFVHHVFFWLKEGASKEELRKGAEELGEIDLVRKIYVGEAVPSPREVVDDSFSLSLLLFFDNKADQDAYQVHPDHDKFIEKCGHLWQRVQVYDAM